jgi:hypothetical protein
VERAKLNWAPHEMVPQVDFFCEKVTLLAEAKEAKAQSESTEVSAAKEMQDVYQQLIAKGWRNITIRQCSCRSNQC